MPSSDNSQPSNLESPSTGASYPTRVRALLGMAEAEVSVQHSTAPLPEFAYPDVEGRYERTLEPESFIGVMNSEEGVSELAEEVVGVSSDVTFSRAASGGDDAASNDAAPSPPERIAFDVPDYSRRRQSEGETHDDEDEEEQQSRAGESENETALTDLSIPGFSANFVRPIIPAKVERSISLATQPQFDEQDAEPDVSRNNTAFKARVSADAEVGRSEAAAPIEQAKRPNRQGVRSAQNRASSQYGDALKNEATMANSPVADIASTDRAVNKPQAVLPAIDVEQPQITPLSVVSEDNGSKITRQPAPAVQKMPSQLLAAHNTGQASTISDGDTAEARPSLEPRQRRESERSYAEQEGEPLMDALNRLSDRIASQPIVRKQPEQEREAEPPPVTPPAQTVIVRRQAGATKNTRAFWERRYMGRAGLRVLR